ncbi:MAG: 2Fe-2S iron-sulfur cluster-binding protein [Gammaproteobacteria bacterium]
MNKFLIKIKGSEIEYNCSEEQSLLAGMEKLAIKGIPVGCRGGGCGVCKVHILGGTFTTKKMSRAHISEVEQNDHYVLACRCSPESDIILEIVGNMKKVL